MLSASTWRVVEGNESGSRDLKKVLIFLLVTCFYQVSCEEKDLAKDASKAYSVAKEPYDDGDYEIALTKLGEFKSRFPYSQYAIEAELLIANSHYELEAYEEAAAAYAQFVKLHPKHQKVAFAMFRVGESYWALSPEDIDREQEFTHKAVEEWEKLVARLPDSPEAKKAQKLIKEGNTRIAQSLEFIADFYCKQEIQYACAYRFIQIAKLYPEFKELRHKSLTKAADALEILAVEKKGDLKSDKNIYFNKLSPEEIKDLAVKLRREAQRGGSKASE